MADNILIQNESADLYSKIVKLITSRKTTVSKAINVTMVTLYWEIGEAICHDVLENEKAEYGKSIIEDISDRLSILMLRKVSSMKVAKMIKNDNKPGITPKDVLKQIDYEHIKEHIPNPEYDFVDFFCGAGGMSYCNAFCQTKVGERATPYNAYAR